MATTFAEHAQHTKLDFDEFLAMQPRIIRETRTSAEIRAWFDAADTNGDEELSLDEFFLWSLSGAAAKHGAESIRAAFEKFDTDGSGKLNAIEFEAACKLMGFGGAVAHHIFRAIDSDHCGVISYKMLSKKLHGGTGIRTGDAKADLDAMKMFTAMMWYGEESSQKIDTTGWRIRGNTAEEVRSELQGLLRASGASVADLLRLFDQDKGDTQMLIDDVEFHSAFRQHLGFRGSPMVIKEVFHMLDQDESGTIGFDELYEFVRGRRHPLDGRNKRVNEISIEPSANAPYRLEDILWDVRTLRELMQRMLAKYNVSAVDLLREWDATDDGQLSFKEFETGMKKFFKGHKELWEREVRPVVAQAFVEIDLSEANIRNVPTHAEGDVVRRLTGKERKQASH